MANFRNGTLYVCVTSNLIKRAYDHKEGLVEGFTKKYGCKQLVYYEQHETMNSALEREKHTEWFKEKETGIDRRPKSSMERSIPGDYLTGWPRPTGSP